MDEWVYPDAQVSFLLRWDMLLAEILSQAREEDGKRPDQKVFDKMAYVNKPHLYQTLIFRLSEYNIHAMRLGPGKHLKGLTLMKGIVKPEEFDYFHEVHISLPVVNLISDDISAHYHPRVYPMRCSRIRRWYIYCISHIMAAC